MTRTSSLFIIATTAFIAALCPAGAEDEDVRRGEGYVYKWGELDPIYDFEHEWRPDFEGVLYAEPQTDSDLAYYEWDVDKQREEWVRIHAAAPEEIFEGSLEDVHVVAGVVIYHLGYAYNESYTAYFPASPERYIPWFKIRSGDVSGWTTIPPIFDGSVLSDDLARFRPYLIGFVDDFSPLVERPRGYSTPLSYKRGGVLEYDYMEFHVGPDVAKGTFGYPIGRRGDWLCIGIGPVNRGWVDHDEPALSVFRLAYKHRLPVEMFATLGLYLPVTDPIGSVGVFIHEYYDNGVRFLADPEITFTTKKGDVSAAVVLTQHDLGHATCDGYSIYYAKLPEEVRREDILEITFDPGNEPDEEYCNEHYVIEFDPAEIWSDGR